MTSEALSERLASFDLPFDQLLMIQHGVDSLAREFKGIFGPETVERYVADSLASLQGASVTLYLPLLAHRFARERLWSLAKVEGKLVTDEPTVLFLCVHNAGRSQMAAGWLANLSRGTVKVMTGGSNPASEVNPNAVRVMEEVGIDVSEQFPKPWTDEVVRAADVVVTMGCGDACPLYPGKRYEDWELDDPSGKSLDEVRAIRDAIRLRVEDLMASLSIPSDRSN